MKRTTSLPLQHIALPLLCLLTCLLPLHTAQGQTKKVIAHGWELLWTTTDALKKNLHRLEALPYDGISMVARMQQPGKAECDVFRFTDQVRFQSPWFNNYMTVGKELCKRKKYNFLSLFWMPVKRLDWHDDKAWEQAAHNLGILSKLAHDMGCRGIILDPEDYIKSNQYSLNGNEDYEQTARVVRQRGRQLMKAMARDFPDITILAFYLMSFNPQLWNTSTPPRELARRTGELWPTFINGLLDELPPTATIVDGCEFGYGLEYDTNGFYKMADDLRHKALELVEPENRDTYRKQVQVGFGHYLDAYVKGYAPTPKPPVDGSVFKRFIQNIRQSLEVADEYCWFYGESNHFINWNGNDKVETWEQKLPGLNDAISFLKNPEAYGRTWLDQHRAAGTLPPSLIPNPACQPMEKKTVKHETDWVSGNLPAGWSFWQGTEGLGTYGLDTHIGRGDTFSLTAKAIGGGCFIASMAVTPGDHYVIEGFCRAGNMPKLGVRWRSPSGWTACYHDVSLPPREDKQDAHGWKRIVGTVVVPQEATQLILLPGDFLVPGNKEQVWFDDINVYRLPLTKTASSPRN